MIDTIIAPQIAVAEPMSREPVAARLGKYRRSEIPGGAVVAVDGATPPTARSEIRSLAGLRGLAACWVMVGHYLGDRPTNESMRFFVSHSYVAVDVFLILSGFILAMTYETRFRGPLTASRYGKFLWQRIARIYPVYAVMTAACMLLVWGGVGIWGDPQLSAYGIVTNFLMVQSWAPPNLSYDAAAWSVSTEWAANLLFPLFIITLGWPLRRSALIAGLVFLCLAGIAFMPGNFGNGATAFGALNWYVFPQSLVRCVAEFMLGIFCWQISAQAGWAGWLGRTPILLVMLAVAAVLIAVTSLDILIVVLTGMIIIGFSQERSWVARAFGIAPLRWLGMVSFSIYLLHMPMMPLRGVLRDVLAQSGVGPADDVATAAMMAMVIATAAVSFRFLERPAQLWLRGLAKTPMQILPAAASAILVADRSSCPVLSST